MIGFQEGETMAEDSMLTRRDDFYVAPAGCKVLYLAGGCFWGMERALQMLDGVVQTEVGYANGRIADPTYVMVKHGDTGYKECVRVTFDPSVVSLETIMKAFFICIDPERNDGQGHDIGDQYRTGVYYRDPSLAAELNGIMEAERSRHPSFYTELGLLHIFYEAEEYHQDYLVKNPSGYCHVTKREFDAVKALNK